MRITLLCIGKTDDAPIAAAIEKFQHRLKHYIAFHIVVIPDIKNTKHLRIDEQKAREAALLMKQFAPADHVVLLDERGKEYRSVEFADYLNKMMVGSVQHVVFVVGGPYGFDDTVYQRANGRIALSKMTFSHQMVRLFFVEQLYRAFSILKGEPYHHE
ncbi:23S rRNA (pseudouridine(1915)-N(3))-methyltransferase RlmH [Parapedobacter koreensis]|uniref:Ribosomal RNA large subunit methyltransferase H n=1 Tax=Parapedobacter koreensis TaxID=332977 RepID=A0A1H7TKS7_9SPHI|nr:23S rRNA (pseudouridine(1915)-N(3))-methyltransferase RlmH [Parapedobacter koreensis]SEL85155.1 23S rRNA (pseudouridine1915-N3)-methyltransferase [Parapedobacter koreensis]